MQNLPIFQADAFANIPFQGNPAAVCILDQDISDDLMQNIAMEMNLAETAFLKKINGNPNHYHLRWFTPEIEVELCGHATLASAHILFEKNFASSEKAIRFETLSGLLSVEKKDDQLTMKFPKDEIDLKQKLPEPLVQQLENALKTKIQNSNPARYSILEVESKESLLAIQPDYNLLMELDTPIGIAVTAPSKENEFDYYYRFFAPKAGINEDPVTGSAACCLAPYWSQRISKNNLVAKQLSKRSGRMQIEIIDFKKETLFIKGQAVTTLTGNIILK